MFKFLFISTALITMISMGVVGNFSAKKPSSMQPTPMMLDSNGVVSFPGRALEPTTAFQIRRAIQTKNTETLSALLVENRLYIAPSDFTQDK